jgi:CRP/FNR family transcriptional regulator
MSFHQQIQGISLFKGVSAESMNLLVARAAYKKYEANQMVVGETDQVRAFYVVISGQLKLSRSSAEGKEQTLSLLGSGEPFGLCTAFATESFPANAIAVEQSVLMVIPGDLVEAVAQKEPTLLLNIIQILSRRLKESMTLIESLALKEVPQRLSSFFLHTLTEKAGPVTDRLELSISHRELAKIIGATPEALSRALKKMSTDGILTVKGRAITILERETLENMAHGG